jgi:two-component system, NtrC family, sensor kinase
LPSNLLLRVDARSDAVTPENDNSNAGEVGPALRILYVDDSYAQLENLRRDLVGTPYQVSIAMSVREATERMQRDVPDLVIIDYHMPDHSGDACLRALRPLGGPSTRYYLYTSDAQAFRRHREMGFDGVFMLKGKSSVRTQVDAVARAMARFRG